MPAAGGGEEETAEAVWRIVSSMTLVGGCESLFLKEAAVGNEIQSK